MSVRGRPSQYSHFSDSVLLGIAEGLTIEEIAEVLPEVSRDMVHYWQRHNPEFQAAVKAVRGIARANRIEKARRLFSHHLAPATDAPRPTDSDYTGQRPRRLPAIRERAA